MPLGEIAIGIFEFISRMIVYIFIDILIMKTGTLIVSLFTAPSKRDQIKTNSFLVILIGFLFWVMLIIVSYIIYFNVFSA